MATQADEKGGRQGGESMVKKHHEKLQAEKEAAGIAKLQAALPKLSRAVLAFALQDCSTDAEKALLVLRQFQSDTFDQLAEIQRKRRALRNKQQRQSSSDSSGSSDGEMRRKHKSRTKEKHKHKSSKSGKSRKVKKEKKDKKEKSKKDKSRRDKAHKRTREGGSSPDGRPERLEFGSYGIIRESDYHAKRPEFAAWATEVKRIDIESLPRGDERDLFREFLEDFNTCTLPDRKYYDLAAHVRQTGDGAQGASVDAGAWGGAFGGDEALRRAELQAERRRAEDDKAREAMTRMMLSKEHLSELKQREMIRLQAQEAYKTGDRDKAQKLLKKLNPDEEDTHGGGGGGGDDGLF